MNIFQYNDELKSYKYPTIKLLICIVLIVAFIYRDHIIHIDSTVVSIIFGVCCSVVGIICIYCIYISIFEILQVHKNKTVPSNTLMDAAANSKAYSIDEIIKMVESNDIIEILIIAKNESVNVGSSSDCKAGSSRFFDKEYYIGKKAYESIHDFRKALLQYSSDGKLGVILIDGLNPKYWKG